MPSVISSIDDELLAITELVFALHIQDSRMPRKDTDLKQNSIYAEYRIFSYFDSLLIHFENPPGPLLAQALHLGPLLEEKHGINHWRKFRPTHDAMKYYEKKNIHLQLRVARPHNTKTLQLLTKLQKQSWKISWLFSLACLWLGEARQTFLV